MHRFGTSGGRNQQENQLTWVHIANCLKLVCVTCGSRSRRCLQLLSRQRQRCSNDAARSLQAFKPALIHWNMAGIYHQLASVKASNIRPFSLLSPRRPSHEGPRMCPLSHRGSELLYWNNCSHMVILRFFTKLVNKFLTVYDTLSYLNRIFSSC